MRHRLGTYLACPQFLRRVHLMALERLLRNYEIGRMSGPVTTCSIDLGHQFQPAVAALPTTVRYNPHHDNYSDDGSKRSNLNLSLACFIRSKKVLLITSNLF